MAMWALCIISWTWVSLQAALYPSHVIDLHRESPLLQAALGG